MTRLDPQCHDVIPDPRDAADTPLESPQWADEDYEGEEDEVETAAARARSAPGADQPISNLKKPASSMKPEEIRAEIAHMGRKHFPGLQKPYMEAMQKEKQPEEKKAT